MSFESLGNILRGSAKKSSFRKGVEAALVIEKFHQIIKDIWGDKIVGEAKALHLKNKKLTVACMSSVAAQEIRLREKEILAAINNKLGYQAVERMRYRL
ncbi:MAG: DUF721 domain-containing protein [Patescibacteria group bacterium]|nr:DUF721 domain-containing protein [Patescibacteria group bacterium]MDD5490445.1 DUF721 domain-containing protein [Patescibacteria group bacterium]